MDSQEFESLNPDEQAKIFHHSSFKERAELIRHSHDPLALTRSLTHEELYLLTREMDLEDRSEVIRYVSQTSTAGKKTASIPTTFSNGSRRCLRPMKKSC
jgi:hypothetical protein